MIQHLSKRLTAVFTLSLLADIVNADFQECPSSCNSCDHNGNCVKCNTGYWNTENECYSECNNNCFKKECDVKTGFCLACKDGFYGFQCQHSCSLCKNKSCDLRSCKDGCNTGYFEYKFDIETLCWPCSEDCITCADDSICNVCKDGYKLHKFDSNGKIEIKCIHCSNESFCLSSCSIQNCKSCGIVNDSLLCRECLNGHKFNGDICVMNENICSDGCSTYCDINGICLGACNVGRTGEKCNLYCAGHCLKCKKEDANLCEECQNDLYTSTCNKQCNPSCRKVTDKRTCSFKDGYCLHGCENKYWGLFCNKSCSDTCVVDGMSKVCDSENGTCLIGCKYGYTGDKCDTVATAKPNMQSEATTDGQQITTSTNTSGDGQTETYKQKDTNTGIIITGSVGGVVLLILTIIVVVFFIRRRRKPKYSGNMNEEIPNEAAQSNHPVNAPNDQEYLYAQPMKPKEMKEMQNNMYAQPIKPHKAKKPSRKEISEPQKLYDNIAIDFEEEQDTAEETNLDILNLEMLDEGPESFIETEIFIPTSDTYYNTASLIRSRIQVSDLLEYIKKKTDYDTEFEKLPKGLTRTCNEALQPQNIAKNRFNGIYAYDATRVVLNSKNYVNANYIDGDAESLKYIASLGPTRRTMNMFEAFWEMIWQDGIEKIVMLTHLKEAGKMKCEQYWPLRNGSQDYGEYYVACTAEMVLSEFVVRQFNIEKGSESRQVTQYHYTAWPDKTVPDSVASLVEFRDKVEQTQTPKAGPMMVHCSAGIGRTGTYIALDMLIKEGREKHYVDVFGCVTALRGQRAHMVQNLEQYIFLHHCVVYALTCDPQPLSEGTIQKQMTDEKIVSQYLNLKKLQTIQNKVQESIAISGRNKDTNIAGDSYKVKLTGSKHDNLNAVYVNGYVDTNKFIIAHTPSPKTVGDFVSMLYQEASPCVVCLDEEHINDKEVGQYIPPTNKLLKFGNYQVACRSSDSKEDVIFRELNISKIGSPSTQDVKIQHYQFKGWKRSDKVPTDIPAFLNLITDVEKARTDHKTEKPIAVHCLKGSERGGIFCAVSILQETLVVQKEVSVINTVCHVCSRRESSFDDIEKFRFCYNCVHEMQKIQEGNIYYNVVKT